MKRTLFLALALGACQSTEPPVTAIYPPRSEAQPLNSTPVFNEAPTDYDFDRAYPVSARRQGVTGGATVECVVLVSGYLGQCLVLEEDPPGLGFGAAAMRVAARFRVPAELPDGTLTTGRTIRRGIVFRAD
jgi:protein TonB